MGYKASRRSRLAQENPTSYDPRNTRRTDSGENGIAVGLICRPGVAIGVAVDDDLVV